MTIDAVKFPQLAKMQDVEGASQAIGEFLDWLGENGMAVCETADGLRGTRFAPLLQSTEQLLARYFGVDLVAVEVERRKVLAEFTAAQAVRAA